MATMADDQFDEGRLDLVPMIDCIMLLLLFFMMTTKFSTEEKAIASLLPTDKGGGNGTTSPLDAATQSVKIAIYPAGLERGQDPAAYQGQVRDRQKKEPVLKKAWIRIGGRPPMEINGDLLNQDAKKAMQAKVDEIHKYLSEELKAFEIPDRARFKQPDVVINCYSGLSWKFALIAYDAVRAYEATAPGHIEYTGRPEDLQVARAVYFAPPRVRNYSATELGDELQEIIHLK